jgi:hypothetical protein
MDDIEVKFNLALPKHVADVLDVEAADIGISRAALIKVIIHNHIKKEI